MSLLTVGVMAVVLAGTLVASSASSLLADLPSPLGSIRGSIPGLEEAPTFSTPVRVYKTQKNFAEPTILVLPNGHLLITTPEDHDLSEIGGPRPFLAFRSTNNGTNWTDVSPPRNASLVNGGDVHLAADGCGTVWGVLSAFTQGKILVFKTTDEGSNWTSFELASEVGSDRPWLTTGACGWVYLVYSVNGVTNDSIRTWHRNGTSGAWTQGGSLSSAADNGEPSNPVYSTATDELFFVYMGHEFKLFLARSTDKGATWSSSEIVTLDDLMAIFPVLARDSAGTLYATWIPLSQRLQYAYSTNSGSNWSSPISVSPSGGASALPWAVAKGAGHVAWVWFRSDAGGFPNPNVNVGPWYVNFTQSLNANTSSPSLTHVRVTPETIHDGGIICTEGASCAEYERQLGDFFQVAVDDAGKAYIAYAKTAGEGSPHQNATSVYFTRQTGGDPLGALGAVRALAQPSPAPSGERSPSGSASEVGPRSPPADADARAVPGVSTSAAGIVVVALGGLVGSRARRRTRSPRSGAATSTMRRAS